MPYAVKVMLIAGIVWGIFISWAILKGNKDGK